MPAASVSAAFVLAASVPAASVLAASVPAVSVPAFVCVSLELAVAVCFPLHAVSDYAMQSVKIEINDVLVFMINFSFK